MLTAPEGVGPLRRAWYKWKTLPLPWRRRFLVGFDLRGNTYWEFRIAGEPRDRRRRIVEYPRSTHFSDVKVTPQWHQWLRYTRPDPPTLEEQRLDVTRQARMQYLAAAADARWEAKPRVMDAPTAATDKAQRLPPMNTDRGVPGPEGSSVHGTSGETEKRAPEVADPWAKAKKRGPGEAWQPQAWTPGASRKS